MMHAHTQQQQNSSNLSTICICVICENLPLHQINNIADACIVIKKKKHRISEYKCWPGARVFHGVHQKIVAHKQQYATEKVEHMHMRRIILCIFK